MAKLDGVQYSIFFASPSPLRPSMKPGLSRDNVLNGWIQPSIQDLAAAASRLCRGPIQLVR